MQTLDDNIDEMLDAWLLGDGEVVFPVEDNDCEALPIAVAVNPDDDIAVHVAPPNPRRRRRWSFLRQRGRGVARTGARIAPSIIMAAAEEIQQAERTNTTNPFLFDLIREGLTCSSSILSRQNQTRGCNAIIECCRTAPETVYYRCPRTGRSPLHEATIRCSCIHTIEAIMEVNESESMHVDAQGNTPLHLLFAGVSTRNGDEADIGAIVNRLLLPTPRLSASVFNLAGNLPLHAACSAREGSVPLNSLERLLEARPETATMANAKGQTPLHLHCRRRRASTIVAKKLIDATRHHNDGQEEFRCSLDAEHGQSQLHSAAMLGNTELVQLLVAEDVASPRDVATGTTSNKHRSALHFLCLSHPGSETLPAVRALLTVAPEMASRPDEQTQYTPLHLLLSNMRRGGNGSISLPIVQALVQSAPAVAKAVDCNHYLALHHACEVGADPAVVSCLLQAYPEGATVLTRKNDTALSLACSTNSSPETVRMLLDAHKHATEQANNYGFLPLHCVCRVHQPLTAIVDALVAANPSSIRSRSHGGEVAAHMASGAHFSVLKVLTSNADNVDALSKLMQSKIGNTPLHTACFRRDVSVESIEAMAESNPEWITASNNAGYSPIQILCKNGRIDDRIVTIFARLSGSKPFSNTDFNGNTPLHSAMREETSVQALRALIGAYPDALQMQTVPYGDTPLHLACVRNVSPDVVREVAEACSTAGHESRAGCSSKTRLSPLVARNSAGQSPIGIAMEAYQTSLRSCGQVSAQCCVQTAQRDGTFNVLASLVKILYYGPGGVPGRDKSLVAACLSLYRKDVHIDPFFIRRALYVCPEEAETPDDDGNYPLHTEAGIPAEKISLLDDTACHVNCCNGACHKRIGIMQRLMEVYPDAAKHRNKAGDFPLCLMIHNGRPWDATFALIVRTHPKALHFGNKLAATVLPHALSRVANECGADTLYALLRERPAMLYEGALEHTET